MEPPLKRMRMSPRDEPKMNNDRAESPLGQARLESGIPYPQHSSLSSSRPVATRTLDLPSTRRRQVQRRGANAGIYLLPRAPEVTVTANVINIGILDGSNEISTTQILAPTTQTEVVISQVGLVTVPAFSQSTGATGSESSDTSRGTSGTASPTGSLSSSLSANATSSDERTVTVTATSTLLIPLRNGTAKSTSSHYKTIFTAEGFTTTLYDGPSTDVTTGYRFGDITTTYKPSSTEVYGVEATVAQTSSSGAATSTEATSGGTIALTPQQQQMVGGVVGGVAGVALVLLGILYLLKWYRQRLKAQGRLPEQRSRHRQLPSGDGHDLIPSSTAMVQTSSSIVPVAALKHSLSKLRPHSNYTLTSTNTDHSSVPVLDMERSFHRVSGRKIPSVLLKGGDGYGEHGPVSPSSIYSSFSRSREVSQVSSYRESGVGINPFLDPTTEDNDFVPTPVMGLGASHRDLTKRSQLSISTAGHSAFNPNRQSDGSVLIRPSPARTPTTTSPTSSSLRLPMHTPPMMAGDIPEMPSLNPFRYNLTPQKFSNGDSSAQRSVVQRTVSGISARTSSSVGGRFKEDI